jgi:hypothetical protein
VHRRGRLEEAEDPVVGETGEEEDDILALLANNNNEHSGYECSLIL